MDLARFDSPAIDSRIQAIRELPIDKQPQAWSALDKLVEQRWFPVTVTGYRRVAMMRGSRVGGLTDDVTFGMPTWGSLWILPH